MDEFKTVFIDATMGVADPEKQYLRAEIKRLTCERDSIAQESADLLTQHCNEKDALRAEVKRLKQALDVGAEDYDRAVKSYAKELSDRNARADAAEAALAMAREDEREQIYALIEQYLGQEDLLDYIKARQGSADAP